MSEIVFVVPGRLDQLTGGYLFDRHIVEGLRARGRAVRVIELSAQDPKANCATFAALPDGSRTVIDGLALATLGQVVAAQARRLRLIAFVHGPLALETDLSPDAAKQAALLEAGILSRVRGILCPSRKTAAALEGYGISSERIAVVSPGTAKPERPPRSRRGSVRALLCVANLVPHKGHELLVEALARLRDLDWNLVCIGSLERDPATVRAVRRKILEHRPWRAHHPCWRVCAAKCGTCLSRGRCLRLAILPRGLRHGLCGSDGPWLAGNCDDGGRDPRNGAASGRASRTAG